MRNKINVFFIFIFILIIVIVPFIMIITKDREFSENENRYLNNRPHMTLNDILSGEYFDRFEKYVDDQFIFRDELYELKTQIQIFVGNKDINGVYLAKDNYLIEKKLDSELDIDKLEENISKINDFANNNIDKSIQVMIVPTASLILKEKLPKNAVEYDQDKILNIIKENIKGATFIDLREELFKHKDEYIYYKTDHHWTSLGSYYAYQVWCKYNNVYADINDYEREVVTSEFVGSLYSKVLNKNVEKDKIEIFKLKENINYEVLYNYNKFKKSSVFDFEKLKIKDKYQIFLGGNYPELRIKINIKNGKNLLVIKDSYANSFIPFLVNNYENIYVVDMRYFKENLDKYMDNNDINEILLLYNTSSLVM